jgi:hypothetical protein
VNSLIVETVNPKKPEEGKREQDWVEKDGYLDVLKGPAPEELDLRLSDGHGERQQGAEMGWSSRAELLLGLGRDEKESELALPRPSWPLPRASPPPQP